MRPKLTYANVMATIAVFIALGGASYAALKLPKNSVGAKQLKKNAVTTAKIKKEAVTAAKVKKGTLTGTQIDASTLGTVPNAQTAQTAQTANSIAAPEPWHEVGAPGEPEFENGWHNNPPAPVGGESVAFYKDREGVVHLKGTATGGTFGSIVFRLPAGYRLATGRIITFPVTCGGCEEPFVGIAVVLGPGIGSEENGVRLEADPPVDLGTIAFRAES